MQAPGIGGNAEGPDLDNEMLFSGLLFGGRDRAGRFRQRRVRLGCFPARPGAVVCRSLPDNFDADPGSARTDHVEALCRRPGEVDNSSLNEGTAVVNAYDNRPAVCKVCYVNPCMKGKCPVCGGQFVGIENLAAGGFPAVKFSTVPGGGPELPCSGGLQKESRTENRYQHTDDCFSLHIMFIGTGGGKIDYPLDFSMEGYTLKKVRRILIVDDNEMNTRVAALALDRPEYIISTALSGQKALELVQDNSFDCIPLDIMMPEMDGYTVCHHLKQNPDTMQIPIIFLTARSDVESIRNAFACGGSDFISKPFQKAELIARVETQLRLKNNVEKIETISRERNELLHILSHDLANPLSAALAVVAMMEDDPEYTVDGLPILRKALQNGSEIRISGKMRDGGKAAVSVRDFGIGIPEEILENLFSFTSKVSRSGTEGETGTGYGMPLVKRFVEAYGGSLEIGSDGSGTTVTCILKAKG